MIGSTLSHYRITAKLGQGGMGEVYAAEDSRLRRQVALKVLPAGMAADPERLARFEREAQAVAALNHPNIVTVYSVEEAEGLRFLTMELVEGATLASLIGPGGMPLERFFDVAVPLADALASAHARGITHRDLKPANVMVTGDGRVKVLDFGLAKLAARDEGPDLSEQPTESLTQQGMLLGTISYMAPEQLRGEAADHRSDIFALGLVLYEMATGRHPFSGQTSAERLSSILRDTPRPVSEIRPEVPGHLGRIVRRCLEKDPEARFQSSQDLRNELADLRKEAAERSGPLRSIAVLPFADLSPDRDQDYFCEGIAEELVNALAKIEGLKVAARTSALQFKEAAGDIREIGRQLGVSAVVEGSVRKAGNKLRVTAQLIKVEDGYQLWSDRYDRELKDVFEIQEEIAQKIVDALQLTLSPRERRALQRVQTADPRAYDYYLRGRQFFYRIHRRSLEFAHQMFSQAIELDPNYALAHAGIADCCAYLYLYHGHTEARREEVERASRRALELDPQLPEAHASRGQAFLIAGDYPAADEEFRMAIRLDPKLFEGYYFYARSCFAQGKLEQAAELFERARELRPEDYQSPLLLALIYKSLGRKAEAEEGYRRGLRLAREHLTMNPDDARARYLGAIALIELGHREQGLDWARQALAMDPEDAHIRYNVACAFSVAGVVEEAIECLEKAEPIFRATWDADWIANDSDLDPLRGHPRFEALMDRLRKGPAGDAPGAA